MERDVRDPGTGGDGRGMTARGRSAAFLATAVAASTVLLLGIFREEITEVLYNAALL
jgi:hypothetical protein